MGVAHHANHFIWFEIGRTELLRARGVDYGRLEDEGIFLPVIEATCAYRAPARYDDFLRVYTQIEGATAVRVAFTYRIESEPGGLVVATGTFCRRSSWRLPTPFSRTAASSTIRRP